MKVKGPLRSLVFAERLGFAIGPFVIGAGGGASGASSEAWQDSSRELTGLSLNELKDRINQSAGATRSQRASVVQTLNQGERSRDIIKSVSLCYDLT